MQIHEWDTDWSCQWTNFSQAGFKESRSALQINRNTVELKPDWGNTAVIFGPEKDNMKVKRVNFPSKIKTHAKGKVELLSSSWPFCLFQEWEWQHETIASCKSSFKPCTVMVFLSVMFSLAFTSGLWEYLSTSHSVALGWVWWVNTA